MFNIYIFVKYPHIQGEEYKVTGNVEGCKASEITYGTTTDITTTVTDPATCTEVKCSPCAKGHYRAAAAPKSTCLKCAAGTKADTTGKEKCDNCPKVSF